jgi:hypothetical protein
MGAGQFHWVSTFFISGLLFPKRVSGIDLRIFSFVSSSLGWFEIEKLEANINGYAFVDFIVHR